MRNKVNLSLVFSLALGFAATASALNPPTVIDINQTPRGIEVISNGITLGDKVIFSGFTDATGSEPYVAGSDGVATLLKDINTGILPSTPADFVLLGGALAGKALFTAFPDNTGVQFFITDGTSDGTQLVAQIPLGGALLESPKFLKSTEPPSEKVILSAFVTGFGREPVLFDASTGNFSIFNVRLGNSSSIPADGAGFDGFHQISPTQFAFTAFIESQGRELAVIDISNPATFTVIDICPNASGSSPGETLFISPNSLFVHANDCTGKGRELLRIDTSTLPNPTIVLVKDLESGTTGSFVSNMVAMGSRLLFVASTFAVGQELFISDGTELGTGFVRDINFGSALGVNNEDALALSDNLAVFFATSQSGGKELWATRGSITNSSDTFPLADIRLGTLGSDPRFLHLTGPGEAAFLADDGINGFSLYKTDGTVSGTSLLKDFVPGSQSETVDRSFAGSTLNYFIKSSVGRQIWRTDGTVSGTNLLAQLDSGGTDSSGTALSNGAPVPETTGFFAASNREIGSELWFTDGNSAGTRFIKDIRPGRDSSSPRDFTRVGDITFFSASDSVVGQELWRTDGTAAGTFLVKDINPGVTGSTVTGLTAFGDLACFRAVTSGDGFELYCSDGTAQGTQRVVNLDLGSSSGALSDPKPVNGKMIFLGTSPGTGKEIFASDGTADGTIAISEVISGTGGITELAGLEKFGTHTVFLTESSAGQELWKTDGTAAGTVRLKAFPEAATNDFGTLIVANSLAYFLSRESASGRELWRTDGTTEGTLPLDLTPGSDPSPVSPLVGLGSSLLMTRFVSDLGFEPWLTDGTVEGTRLLKDINPGNASPNIGFVLSAFNRVFFGASNVDTGNELWVSDGTTDGTQLVADIFPGTPSSLPGGGLAASRSHILFTAEHPEFDRELFSILMDACPDDLAKDLPGVCGCGVVDIDGDLDGTLNCQDSCPADPAKVLVGVCGCSVPDADLNANGILDCQANAELLARLGIVKGFLRQLRVAKDKKTRKKVRAAKKAIKLALADAESFTLSGSISVNGIVSLESLFSTAKRAVLKAAKVKAKTFTADKRRATNSLAALEAALR